MAGTPNRPSWDSGMVNGGRITASVGRTVKPNDFTNALDAPKSAVHAALSVRSSPSQTDSPAPGLPPAADGQDRPEG
jgi:hypothetical protein